MCEKGTEILQVLLKLHTNHDYDFVSKLDQISLSAEIIMQVCGGISAINKEREHAWKAPGELHSRHSHMGGVHPIVVNQDTHGL
jgi:hypothetical protein